MRALNRAFEKAFAHNAEDDNIDELLSCMGEEMGCERISIFEEGGDGTCDNTYEWCRPGVVREQVLLQHVAVSQFDTWHDRLVNRETIVVHEAAELRDHDPDVYRMFTEQGIHSALVTLLAFHGRIFGFCILEDPAPEVMGDHDLIMPGIRYVLSSMIYSRNLVARLRRIGYTDSLTGVGNRVSLQEYLLTLDFSRPLDVMAVDVVGWDDGTNKLAHLEREQTLLHGGDILCGIFGVDQVFRVSTGEFVVVESDVDHASFEASLKTVRGLMRENNLLAAVAGTWRARLDERVDALIHEVHQQAAEERRILVSHREEARLRHEAATELGEPARIELPKGDAFFRLADQFLGEVYEGLVLSVVVDINYFKLYNDIFGRRSGNVFLENVARIVSDASERYRGVCGYIGGDNFCLIAAVGQASEAEVAAIIDELYASLEYPDGFAPALGAYLSDDRREPMIALYDRALSALAEIKGDYLCHVHFYNAEAHRHQREDKLLLMQVKEGLAREEFIFYVQPQVNDRTGKIIGGEALVRWLRDGQLVPPGKFIPVLEKTGYVYTVDAFVWEAVAAWQRSLIDRGIRPVPISVNVSRVDFYFDDIAEHFIGLVEKYDLDPALLGVEITESAFTDNVDVIVEAIRRLHDAGFRVMMDDFGSGSSSLSMLHTMNLDVLKTDVQFMSKDMRDGKAISIVESIISMAHMIGMSVVTEGVETEEQRQNLIALGDNFAQGFYFFRPMPKEQFEELIADPANVGEGYHEKSTASTQLSLKDMIRDGLVSDSLLDNIIRAAAVLREEAGMVSLVQYNQPYAQAVGLAHGEDGVTFEGMEDLLAAAGSHPLGGSEGVVSMRRADGRTLELAMRLFLLYSLDDHRLYLSTLG